MDVDLPKAIWNGVEWIWIHIGSTYGFRGMDCNPAWIRAGIIDELDPIFVSEENEAILELDISLEDEKEGENGWGIA